MRKHFLLMIALAMFGVLVLAATAGARRQAADLLDTSSAAVEVNLPGGQDLPALEDLPQCSNEIDDDEDGKTDDADDQCDGPLDDSEKGAGLQPVSDDPPMTGGGEEPPADGGDDPGGDGSGGRGGGNDGGRGEHGGGRGGAGHGGGGGGSQPPAETPARNADGSPTDANPGLTVADFGSAPIGVPNFVIDQFSIPPFLLPIYQACGTQYGIPWQVLASINRIETAFGTNLNVSTAGALGWMQFMPATWKAYGVDANDDGRKDPYNPVDAICAAAR
ncbi:MAG: lytic transglycosylase domain-containing protein, partial [bacterium]